MSYISKDLLCLAPGFHTGFIPAQEVLSLSKYFSFQSDRKFIITRSAPTKKRMQAFSRIRFLFSSHFRDIFRTLAAYIIPASSAVERQHSHHTGNKTQ